MLNLGASQCRVALLWNAIVTLFTEIMICLGHLVGYLDVYAGNSVCCERTRALWA